LYFPLKEEMLRKKYYSGLFGSLQEFFGSKEKKFFGNRELVKEETIDQIIAEKAAELGKQLDLAIPSFDELIDQIGPIVQFFWGPDLNKYLIIFSGLKIQNRPIEYIVSGYLHVGP
jgi:hypothetical protein